MVKINNKKIDWGTNFKNNIELSNTFEIILMKAFGITKNSKNDVRNNKYYQKKDIDFISKKGYKIEIKNDFTYNKTIFWEIISNGNKGWHYKIEADYLIYYFVNQGKGYIINVPKLKEWIDNLTWHEYNKKNRIMKFSDYKNTTTSGLSLTIKEVLEHGSVEEGMFNCFDNKWLEKRLNHKINNETIKQYI